MLRGDSVILFRTFFIVARHLLTVPTFARAQSSEQSPERTAERTSGWTPERSPERTWPEDERLLDLVL